MQSILTTGEKLSEIVVSPITLSNDYSIKYKESEEKISNKVKVLTKVIVPEYIIVHDGVPSNYSAANYYIPFKDYIKNVASSEVYPTWNKEALKANVLAIISFTLNRIYTEWYPSKGYNFSITSTTSYDQKFIYNKAIFREISNVVDEILPLYIKRKNKSEPLFAQYCDGVKLKNEGWLWQWGSNDLASKGKNYIEILEYYYGQNIEFQNAFENEGLPTSFPGYNLNLNSCGEPVAKIQNQLNIIRGNYPKIPLIEKADGIFREETKNAIKVFQEIFFLSITGLVDYSTWYKISYIYSAVERMIQGVYDK